MTYRIRRPELIPTLATLIVVAVTFYLAVWQLERLAWKTDLLATIEKAQSEAPRELGALPEKDLETNEWHNIVVSGNFQHDKEIHATPRFLNGILGYGVMTPLQFMTPKGTRYVLVNRGWVAPEDLDVKTRSGGNPTSRVRVEGTIRSSLTKGGGFTQGRFTPENDAAKNLWYWYDMPAITKALGVELLPIIIDETAEHNTDGKAIIGGPKAFPIEINIRNDHLGYAVTWFLLGICAIVIYLLYYTEKKKA